jgi:hypothetical protein
VIRPIGGGWRRGRDSTVEARAIPARAFPAASPPAALPCVALLLLIVGGGLAFESPVSRYIKSWRRGRDSNPRGGYKPPTRFPVAFLRPARTPLRTDNRREKPVPKRMAEREGFEPSVQFYPYNRLAGGCLQPARPPLPRFLAEGAGFEPAGRRRPAVFKTAAFNRSAIPPRNIYLYQIRPPRGSKKGGPGRLRTPMI